MNDQAKFTIDENATVIVEFPPKPGWGEVSRLTMEDLARKSSDALNATMNTIYHMACRVVTTIEAISDRPDHVEVDFGIKFDAEAGAVLAKAGTECSINVKLIWERKVQQ